MTVETATENEATFFNKISNILFWILMFIASIALPFMAVTEAIQVAGLPVVIFMTTISMAMKLLPNNNS